jgi:hypothetical protein
MGGIAWQIDRLGILEGHRGLLGILADVYEHRTRTAGVGNVKGFFDGIW